MRLPKKELEEPLSAICSAPEMPADPNVPTIPLRRTLTLTSPEGDLHVVTSERVFEDALFVRKLYSVVSKAGFEKGDACQVSYADKRGYYHFETSVLRPWEMDSFLWLAPPPQIHHVQRRQYVRTRVALAVRYRVPDGCEVSATTRDLSGNGALIVAPAPLIVGTPLSVDLDLTSPFRPLRNLDALVVRAIAQDEDPATPWLLAVRFPALSDEDLDELVRFVFEEEVPRRA